MAKKAGRIIPNGVYLQDHEYETVLFLTEQGYDVELIAPSDIMGEKTPDIFMNGYRWEMKSPKGKGKWTIKNIMQKASRQSENIIIDIRRLKQFPQEKYISEIEQRFELTKRFKRLMIIGKGNFFREIIK